MQGTATVVGIKYLGGLIQTDEQKHQGEKELNPAYCKLNSNKSLN